MTALIWLVLTAAVPAAQSAESLTAWRAWFWSEPGGPLDVPGHSAPAPAPAAWADWRDFEPPTDLSRAFGDAAFSDVARGADGIARVAYRYGGDVFLAQRTAAGPSAGWRHERIAGAELEWGELALALDSRGRTHVGYEAIAPDGGKRWVHAVREPFGLWTFSELAAGVRSGNPWFSAGPEGGLALFFSASPTAMPTLPVAPSPRPWSRAWLLLVLPGAGLGRLLLVFRRLRARRRLRTEAALIGRGHLLDVVVRRRGGARLAPAAAGVLLLHARTPVLFIDGLKPSEAWLGSEWALSEGRPGWVEGRCGPVTLEFAPESGLWPAFSGRAARTLLDAIRAERAAKAGRLVS